MAMFHSPLQALVLRQLDFSTRDEMTPPVQLCAGRPDVVAPFNLGQLVCLFCHALKDQCWASMHTTGVMASHRAVIYIMCICKYNTTAYYKNL